VLREPVSWALASQSLRAQVCSIRASATAMSIRAASRFGAWRMVIWSSSGSVTERGSPAHSVSVGVCGGGDYLTMLLGSREKPQVLRTLGVWAFHGAKDPVVPLSESERMVKFLKDLGVKDVKLTVYPDAEHNSWAQTYDNPELYQWLLAHQRK